MRLNEAKRIVFKDESGDVTFLVYRNYGKKRHYQKALLATGYKEDMTVEERADFFEKTEGLAEEALAGMVVSIEGLTGEDGEAITKWRPGLLAELPEACGEMLTAMVSGVKTAEEGNASSGLPTPPANTGEATA